MNDNKCTSCSEYKNCKESFASWIFFIIGIIATVALRVVTVLMDINPLYGKLAWYIGVSGFFLFFIYKFKISEARSRLIDRASLVRKVKGIEKLEKSDYEALGAILCALSSKKEKINYFFIFALSALALIVALYIDLLR